MLDICVLAHNHDWLDLSLRSIRQHSRGEIRLYVADQELPDLLRRVVNRYADEVVTNRNVSWAQGLNRLASLGHGDFIAFVDDDVIVTPGWDVEFAKTATEGGLVGARCQPGFEQGHQGNPARTDKPSGLAFFCAGMQRAIWNQLGPFDEALFDGWAYGDIDYCRRALKAGLDLKVSDAFVFHVSVTHGAGAHPDDQKYWARLVEKWGGMDGKWITKVKAMLEGR
ncbi:MAG: glycosyltransferase family 2 protein [Terriglobales bacterium]